MGMDSIRFGEINVYELPESTNLEILDKIYEISGLIITGRPDSYKIYFSIKELYEKLKKRLESEGI